jgi:hypothetical protein
MTSYMITLVSPQKGEGGVGQNTYEEQSPDYNKPYGFCRDYLYDITHQHDISVEERADSLIAAYQGLVK